jgi:hypothetical protein
MTTALTRIPAQLPLVAVGAFIISVVVLILPH